ncbi:MAG: hypothetical protein QM731_08910 [Chitinophagaceae bacterium]
MNITVLIALISSLASIVIAVVSLVSTINTNKNNKKTVMELEVLKFELERKRNINSFVAKETEKEINALDKFISGIQQMKDQLNRIINSIEKSYSAKVASTEISNSIHHILEIYQMESHHFKDEPLRIAHYVKNKAIQVDALLNPMLSDVTFVSLKQEEKNLIQHINEELTDNQTLLRDLKYQLILKHVS